jgi:peptidoglycan hydrolase-like protein with peptidoglycan-binding domain
MLVSALVVGMAGIGHAAEPGAMTASEILTRATQQQLQFSGLYRGSLDGKMSAETQQALLRFQLQRGLRPTGALDDATMAALQADDPVQAGSSRAPQMPLNAGSDENGDPRR